MILPITQNQQNAPLAPKLIMLFLIAATREMKDGSSSWNSFVRAIIKAKLKNHGAIIRN
jgi:hypothetical protein